MMTVQQQSAPKDGTSAVGRRGFLSKAGTAALAMPLTTSLVVSASSMPAVAKSPYGGGGGGGHKPGGKGHKGPRGKHKAKHKVSSKKGRG